MDAKVITDQPVVNIQLTPEEIKPIPQDTSTLVSDKAVNPQAPIQEAKPKEELSTSNPQKEDKPKVGRPCEYCQNKEKIDKITKEYLESARSKKGTREGFVPYQQELADMLDVDNDTIWNWATKKNDKDSLEHEEFFGLIKKLNNFKELMLLKRTMGRYNPTGAIFQLKTKHGYIETEKQVLAGDKNEPLTIEVIEERKIPDAQ